MWYHLQILKNFELPINLQGSSQKQFNFFLRYNATPYLNCDFLLKKTSLSFNFRVVSFVMRSTYKDNQHLHIMIYALHYFSKSSFS